ncbi:transposase, partial [Enorma massiliensis]|uniref:transposase n=1 Tax=Enorma massiliensis TaxID=1472761 RepID=UPI003AB355E4
MARSARATLPSDFIHVTTRGLGRRIIFEDDLDKERFLSILSTKLTDSESRVYAWCLMDNHIHLLLRANSADLSKSMQRIGVSYAQYFNGRHGHVGKVFQNRFNAHPIMGETHLLATIRYIHRNPPRNRNGDGSLRLEQLSGDPRERACARSGDDRLENGAR